MTDRPAPSDTPEPSVPTPAETGLLREAVPLDVPVDEALEWLATDMEAAAKTGQEPTDLPSWRVVVSQVRTALSKEEK